MSGLDETPDGESEVTEEFGKTVIGETLYDESGDAAGTVRGMSEDGIFVTTQDGYESLSVEHVRSGHSFGEAELVWWGTNCGEMGEIEGGLPDTCPGCDTRRENLTYWIED